MEIKTPLEHISGKKKRLIRFSTIEKEKWTEKKNQIFFTSRVRANDDPHGVFSLKPEQQSLVVVGSGSQVNRALVINVTRLAGLFGNASVGYKIGGEAEEVMDIGEIVGGHAEGRLSFSEGQMSSAVTVLISREVAAAAPSALSERWFSEAP